MCSTYRDLCLLVAFSFLAFSGAYISHAEIISPGAPAADITNQEPASAISPSSPSQSNKTGKRARRRARRASRSSALRSGTALPAFSELMKLTEGPEAVKAHDKERWHYHESYKYLLQQSVITDQRSLNTYKRASDKRAKMFDVQISMKGLLALEPTSRWEFLGPRNLPAPERRWHGEGTVSGRVNGVAFDPKKPNVIYVASAGGGFWKSEDKGESWTCLSDDWDNVKFSSVAIHPQDSDTIIVGTGDYAGAHGYGYGLMMTTDGGKKWNNLLRDELWWYNVSQIIFDPDNPQIITITAGRHPRYGGKIFRSVNGGQKWSPVNLPVAFPIDWNNVQVSLKKTNGRRNYYAVGVRSGNNYALAGLRGSEVKCGPLQIWHSIDDGHSWTSLPGPPVVLPPPDMPQGGCAENVDVAPSATSPDTFYLLTANYSYADEAQAGQIWVMDLTTGVWKEITNNFPHEYDPQTNHADNWSQSGYNFYIKSSVNPVTGQDIIYVGLIDLVASTDGGQNWQPVGEVYTADAKTHSDQHAIAVNPGDPNDLLVGNDGGVYRLTYNPVQQSWNFQSHLNAGLGMTMFYRIAVHPKIPDWVMGGTQDNATPVSMGDLTRWSNKGFGDGGFCVIHPVNQQVQYATAAGLRIYHTKDAWASGPVEITGSETFINDMNQPVQVPWGGEIRGFIAPIALDPKDPNRLYAGTNYLWRRDEGQGWTMRLGNQALAKKGGWVSFIAIAPTDSKRIYTGSNWGDLWMTTDGGDTWQRIDNNDLPSALPVLPITSIAVHPQNPDSILVAYGGMGDESHLRRCDNTRAVVPRWRKLGVGESMLESVPLYDIVIDSRRPDTTYYIASDLGVFRTNDGGNKWEDFGARLGLPKVRVSDLHLLPDSLELVAGTFGRGAWRLKLSEMAEPLFFQPSAEPHLGLRRARRRARRR